MGKKLQYLSLFAFLALMFIKVSALHVYTHHLSEDATVEECGLCDLAIENQSCEIVIDTPVDITFQHIFFENDSLIPEEQDSFYIKKEHLYLFLRPPPSV